MSDTAGFRTRLADFFRIRPYPFLGLVAFLLVVRVILHPTLGAVIGGLVSFVLLRWWWTNRNRSPGSFDAGSPHGV